MNRRAFLCGLTAILAGPIAVKAQQAQRPVTIGMLCTGWCPFPSPPEASRPLIFALEHVGLVSGRTLTWDFGSIVNSERQIGVEARNLVLRRPDLILVWPGSIAAARAAKDATRTIPIVLMAVSDAVENGLVENLRRPGANITGMSVPLFDLTIKQIQLLKEINPQLKRILVVQGHLDSGERKTVDRLRRTATSLGLDAGGIDIIDAANMEQALSTAHRSASAILGIGSWPAVVQKRIPVLALERKLPLIMPWRAWDSAGDWGGILIAYGPHFPTVAERTAVLIDRILKGATPADLPVEEPTRYELVIDGVMAKALGLTIPQSVLLRADQVIE